MSNETKQAIKFVVQNRKAPRSQPNTCYLMVSDWDDYFFRTTFKLYFVNKDRKGIEIGELSITQKGLQRGYVEMPSEEFDQLSDDYCSLGHSQGYYEELMGIDGVVRENILKALRDCVYSPAIQAEFKNEPSYQKSLLRHVSPYTLTLLFPAILRGNAAPTPYEFEYLLNGNSTTRLEFKVVPASNPPTNVHVLVGRNGVGKTRILAGIADKLTNNSSPISQPGEIRFSEESLYSTFNYESRITAERFANLITVVFSAFDNFEPIESDKTEIPYHYIGLKTTRDKLKTPQDLKKEFVESLQTTIGGQRKSRWKGVIEILNSDPIFREYELLELVDGDTAVEQIVAIFDKLSSGHKIVLLTVTRLVELVDEKTLVLIDELENHLHPPLLSSFIRAISDLLVMRNAVAIIATHSPVILQEVPSSCVTKIDRVGTQYSLFRPDIETYGESIGTLTREVFGLEVLESGFYKTIKDFLRENNNYNDLLEKFHSQIGSEGKAVARSIIIENRDSNA